MNLNINESSFILTENDLFVVTISQIIPNLFVLLLLESEGERRREREREL